MAKGSRETASARVMARKVIMLATLNFNLLMMIIDTNAVVDCCCDMLVSATK
jgi:hypothetical protein